MLELLAQEPVRRVVTRLVTKAAKSGEVSASLPLDGKLLPEVYNASSGEDADFYWGLLKDAEQQGLIHIELKRARAACAEYERSPKASLVGRSLAEWRMLVGMPAEDRTYKDDWRDALARKLAAPADVAAQMESYQLEFVGIPASEVVDALNRLLALRNEPLLLREASSRAFWGMSKVLDTRAEMVARLFQVAECPFPSAPLHLDVRLPAGPLTGVLFVENVTTYERLAKADGTETAGLALVYGAGARATAKRVVRREGASIFYAMSPGFTPEHAAAFEAFMFDAAPLPAFFFGDLDYAGMRILKSLRDNYPSLTAWVPGYAKLLARLQDRDGHTPDHANKAGQSDPDTTGCPYADGQLLPAMRASRLFVDQE